MPPKKNRRGGPRGKKGSSTRDEGGEGDAPTSDADVPPSASTPDAVPTDTGPAIFEPEHTLSPEGAEALSKGFVLVPSLDNKIFKWVPRTPESTALGKAYLDGAAEFNRRRRDELKREDANVGALIPLVDEDEADESVAPEGVPSSVAAKERAMELRARGNRCFSEGDFEGARRFYTLSLAFSSEDKSAASVVLANRSVSNLRLGEAEDALVDALAAMALDPLNAKAHARAALALHACGSVDNGIPPVGVCGVGRYMSAVCRAAVAKTLDPALTDMVAPVLSPSVRVDVVRDGDVAFKVAREQTGGRHVIVVAAPLVPGPNTTPELNPCGNCCLVGLPRRDGFPMISFMVSPIGQQAHIEDVCIDAFGHCVVVRHDRMTVVNCDLRGSGAKMPAVFSLCGTATVVGCRISSEMSQGVSALGVAASATVLQCAISRCGWPDVRSTQAVIVRDGSRGVVRWTSVSDNARGIYVARTPAGLLLEDSEFVRVTGYALSVQESGKIVVRRCRMVECAQEFAVTLHGRITDCLMEDCLIARSGGVGMTVRNLSNVVIKGSHIKDNRKGGIHYAVNFSGRLQLERTVVSGSPYTIKDDGGDGRHPNPTVQRAMDFYRSFPPAIETTAGCHLQPPLTAADFVYHPPQTTDCKLTTERVSRAYVGSEVRKHTTPPKKCAKCGRTDGKLRVCSQCMAVKYCSATCQQGDWRAHRDACLVSDEASVVVTVRAAPLRSRDGAPVAEESEDGATRSALASLPDDCSPPPKLRSFNTQGKRFLVKIQSRAFDPSDSEPLRVWDCVHSLNGVFVEPRLFARMRREWSATLVRATANRTHVRPLYFWALAEGGGDVVQLRVLLAEAVAGQLW